MSTASPPPRSSSMAVFPGCPSSPSALGLDLGQCTSIPVPVPLSPPSAPRETWREAVLDPALIDETTNSPRVSVRQLTLDFEQRERKLEAEAEREITHNHALTPALTRRPRSPSICNSPVASRSPLASPPPFGPHALLSSQSTHSASSRRSGDSSPQSSPRQPGTPPTPPALSKRDRSSVYGGGAKKAKSVADLLDNVVQGVRSRKTSFGRILHPSRSKTGLSTVTPERPAPTRSQTTPPKHAGWLSTPSLLLSSPSASTASPAPSIETKKLDRKPSLSFRGIGKLRRKRDGDHPSTIVESPTSARGSLLHVSPATGNDVKEYRRRESAYHFLAEQETEKNDRNSKINLPKLFHRHRVQPSVSTPIISTGTAVERRPSTQHIRPGTVSSAVAAVVGSPELKKQGVQCVIDTSGAHLQPIASQPHIVEAADTLPSPPPTPTPTIPADDTSPGAQKLELLPTTPSPLPNTQLVLPTNQETELAVCPDSDVPLKYESDLVIHTSTFHNNPQSPARHHIPLPPGTPSIVLETPPTAENELVAAPPVDDDIEKELIAAPLTEEVVPTLEDKTPASAELELERSASPAAPEPVTPAAEPAVPSAETGIEEVGAAPLTEETGLATPVERDVAKEDADLLVTEKKKVVDAQADQALEPIIPVASSHYETEARAPQALTSAPTCHPEQPDSPPSTSTKAMSVRSFSIHPTTNDPTEKPSAEADKASKKDKRTASAPSPEAAPSVLPKPELIKAESVQSPMTEAGVKEKVKAHETAVKESTKTLKETKSDTAKSHKAESSRLSRAESVKAASPKAKPRAIPTPKGNSPAPKSIPPPASKSRMEPIVSAPPPLPVVANVVPSAPVPVAPVATSVPLVHPTPVAHVFPVPVPPTGPPQTPTVYSTTHTIPLTPRKSSSPDSIMKKVTVELAIPKGTPAADIERIFAASRRADRGVDLEPTPCPSPGTKAGIKPIPIVDYSQFRPSTSRRTPPHSPTKRPSTPSKLPRPSSAKVSSSPDPTPARKTSQGPPILEAHTPAHQTAPGPPVSAAASAVKVQVGDVTVAVDEPTNTEKAQTQPQAGGNKCTGKAAAPPAEKKDGSPAQEEIKVTTAAGTVTVDTKGKPATPPAPEPAPEPKVEGKGEEITITAGNEKITVSHPHAQPKEAPALGKEPTGPQSSSASAVNITINVDEKNGEMKSDAEGATAPKPADGTVARGLKDVKTDLETVKADVRGLEEKDKKEEKDKNKEAKDKKEKKEKKEKKDDKKKKDDKSDKNDFSKSKHSSSSKHSHHHHHRATVDSDSDSELYRPPNRLPHDIDDARPSYPHHPYPAPYSVPPTGPGAFGVPPVAVSMGPRMGPPGMPFPPIQFAPPAFPMAMGIGRPAMGMGVHPMGVGMGVFGGPRGNLPMPMHIHHGPRPGPPMPMGYFPQHPR